MLRRAPALEERKEAAQPASRGLRILGRAVGGDELREWHGLVPLRAQILVFRALFRARIAAFAPTVTQRAELSPTLREAFADHPEADRRGKIETAGGKRSRDQPGALNVQIDDQDSGHEPSDHAFHGNHVQPAPMPRQQSKDSGQKDQGEHCTHPAQDRRAAGPRLHPGPAHAAQPNGQQKSRQAERLQQQIAQVRAKETDPVPGRRGIRGRVQRGVRGVVGCQSEEKKKRDQNQHHPQKHVQGAAARRRQNNADGLHDKGGFAHRLSAKALLAELYRQNTEEQANHPRATSIIGVWRGGPGQNRAKRRRGEPATLTMDLWKEVSHWCPARLAQRAISLAPQIRSVMPSKMR